MSNAWYPIIDSEKCTGCSACFEKCKKGVYAIENEKPVVVYPDGCVTGCHGCEPLCPTAAISYFGDAPTAGCCNL